MPPPPSVSEAKRRLREIVRRSDKLGITREEMTKLATVAKLRSLADRRRSRTLTWIWQGSGWVLLIAAAAFLSVAALFVCYGGTPVSDALRQQQYQALVSFPYVSFFYQLEFVCVCPKPIVFYIIRPSQLMQNCYKEI